VLVLLMKFWRIVFICFVLLPIPGVAMAIFDAGKACVFSAVEGVLTLNGEPVKGATIMRKVEWQREDSDATVTDEKGYFRFPAMYHRSVMKLFPAEFVASQDIIAIVDGKEYFLWHTTKREPGENAELQGTQLNFKCELSNEPRFDHSYDASIETICTWK
jgi:hypothetical protein